MKTKAWKKKLAKTKNIRMRHPLFDNFKEIIKTKKKNIIWIA